MEEWRSGKDSKGRVAEAQWKLVMQGTKVVPVRPPVHACSYACSGLCCYRTAATELLHCLHV